MRTLDQAWMTSMRKGLNDSTYSSALTSSLHSRCTSAMLLDVSCSCESGPASSRFNCTSSCRIRQNSLLEFRSLDPHCPQVQVNQLTRMSLLLLCFMMSLAAAAAVLPACKVLRMSQMVTGLTATNNRAYVRDP